ncbi:MAG: sn-glycerol-3-phosphate ABC transporter ATP-binding protein UgpC [Candidatus Dormiibacterota bacterium]
MAGVVLDDLTKRYDGGALAVDKLNLDIQDGEFVCLVGPSGCGKTTALRMIAGLEEITSGEVRIGDRVVNNLPPRDRDIAMVFQSYALYPHMSVRDNMAFGLQLRKTPKADIDKAVVEAARILDLERFLDRKPGQLSGGQRQRVALGRAIVREPAVFLMDEPLSNLDAKLRVQTRAEIARMHTRLAATMIYVTHDQVEAMTMGDRIAVINEGVLQQAGSPKDLYELPQNRFVAGFIGSPSMNFIDVKVTQDGGVLRLVGESAEMRPDDTQAALLRDQGLETVAVGFRPEHLELAPLTGPGLSLTVVVDVVEFLGNDELIHGSSGGRDVVAIIDADNTLTVGQSVTLSCPPRRLHLFNPTTGLRIAKDGVPGNSMVAYRVTTG